MILLILVYKPNQASRNPLQSLIYDSTLTGLKLLVPVFLAAAPASSSSSSSSPSRSSSAGVALLPPAAAPTAASAAVCVIEADGPPGMESRPDVLPMADASGTAADDDEIDADCASAAVVDDDGAMGVSLRKQDKGVNVSACADIAVMTLGARKLTT